MKIVLNRLPENTLFRNKQAYFFITKYCKPGLQMHVVKQNKISEYATKLIPLNDISLIFTSAF